MLVTKLDSIVSDNSLLKIGEHRVTIPETPSVGTAMQHSFRIINDLGATTHIRTTDGEFFNDSAHTESLGSSVNRLSPMSTLFFSDTTKDVIFDNKYNITNFLWNLSSADLGDGKDLLWNASNLTNWESYGAIVEMETSDFTTATLLNKLICQSPKFIGNVNQLPSSIDNLNISDSGVTGTYAELATLVNLIKAEVKNTALAGDLVDLAPLVNINTLLLQGTTLTGTSTPQDLADAMFAAGRTSGTLSLVLPNSISWTLTFTVSGGTATQNPIT